MSGGGDRSEVEQRVAEGAVVGRPSVGNDAEQMLIQEQVAEPCERAPLVAEDVHRNLPATVQFADDGSSADMDVVEGDLGKFVGAVGLFDGADVDARRTEVDDEGGEPAVAGVGRARASQEQAPGGVAGPTRPDLPAGDDETVVDRCGGRAHAGEVGTGVGFGEALGPELATGQQLREQPGDEWLGPVGHQDRSENLQVLEERHAGYAVAGEGLPHGRPVQNRAAEAADRVGHP